jgi:uncharacterized coiled-coil DUF342 family protein
MLSPMAGHDSVPVRAQHPALLALENAPTDDEPVTEAEERAVEEAREQVRRGEVLTTDELMRDLGL